MLHLYNTLTRTKELFVPLHPGKIGMYVCGITVYDKCHLGHARSMVCFDVMVRFFRAQGYEVTYVRNITDVDDKIILRAVERGISIETLTDECIQSMHEDAQALRLLPPDIEPRSTNYIPYMIQLIQTLIDKNYAYQSEQGDVCFEVKRFQDYGKLSRQVTDDLASGSRIDIVQEKRSPLDFVLWKKAKLNEPCWPSPWGDGRPGWHIECSAMAMDTLGEQFDIHGGGVDIQFPHHENEIAQSEACSDKQFATYWLHVGMLQVNNEKMAKSVGNFFTISSILETYHPEVVRYFLLNSHYRSPLNYSADSLDLARKSLQRLYQTIKEVPVNSSAKLDEKYVAAFNAAMSDDFNTPIALSVLFELSHATHKEKSGDLAYTLKHLAGILGLLQESPEAFLQAGISKVDEVEQLIGARIQARNARDYAKADAIRQQLAELGVELEDNAQGTTWRIST